MTSGEVQTRPWRIIGGSVRGASHRREGTPNQDAIAWVPESGILAVADGHGSAQSFRSDIGADLAVKAAIAALEKFLHCADRNDGALRHTAAGLVSEWIDRVSAHVEQNPFPRPQRNPLLAYGSTILAVLATDEFLLYLQLGDGDILIVSETGEVRRPWPRDERLFGGETTSLCSSDAQQEMRVTIESDPADLVLLSTDGYANSFRSDDGFLRVGSDYLDLIRTDGADAVNGHLKPWLEEVSQLGSGDDITVGILWR